MRSQKKFRPRSYIWEQIENPKNSSVFQKNVCLNKNIASNTNNLEEYKNAALDLWDLPLLRKRGKTNNKNKQQQQTSITSKTLCPFLLKNCKHLLCQVKARFQLDKKAAKLIIAYIFKNN